MNNYLQDYLQKHDYSKVAQDAVAWVREWFDHNGPDSPAVIGISGGKDSSIVAAICAKALGKDRVFGVLMPDGTQSDIEVSRRLVSHLGIPHAVVNIQAMTQAFHATIEESLGDGFSLSRQSTINLPPRVRMTTLYAISQSMNGRVSNNGNRSERYAGYFTIHGDSAGDFAPLANLTVSELRVMGSYLDLPEEFVQKVPSDGLTGSSDEDNLGFTYEQLDTYLLTGICEDEQVKTRIQQLYARNKFKTSPMAMFVPEV